MTAVLLVLGVGVGMFALVMAMSLCLAAAKPTPKPPGLSDLWEDQAIDWSRTTAWDTPAAYQWMPSDTASQVPHRQRVVEVSNL